ncbi:MAG: transposase [Ktedonobacteraceae bacterium]|jgi:transposase-like protein
MKHCSTPQQRIEWMTQLLASPACHGMVSQVSREHHVSRQTLYRWKQKAEQALKDVFMPPAAPRPSGSELERQVLTLLIEAHASYRQIQTCLASMLGTSLSLGSICSMVAQAGERARAWLSRQRSLSVRALALDEQYSSKRGEAYFNVVDVHSGQVWASLPPAAVEGDSWMIVLWDLQAQGVTYGTTVSDGGNAIHEALKELDQLSLHQRDVWHLFHLAAKIQGRVETALAREEERLHTIRRYEERQARGERFSGRPPKTTAQTQQRIVSHLFSLWEAVAYLFHQVHHLLDVVILDATSASGLLSAPRRQAELETLICLLFELEEQACTNLKPDLHLFARQMQLALPSLLHFTHPLEDRHHQAAQALSCQAVQLIAWAWQRRTILGPDVETLLDGLAPAWRPIARQLFEGWNQAVRASSVVENWHSIVRPHLAVHRTLSAGMLALLAVWHNHRIAPRGPHADLSPLQRSQADHREADWLTALGYLPVAA